MGACAWARARVRAARASTPTPAPRHSAPRCQAFKKLITEAKDIEGVPATALGLAAQQVRAPLRARAGGLRSALRPRRQTRTRAIMCARRPGPTPAAPLCDAPHARDV
jgi:hypothetical protein